MRTPPQPNITRDSHYVPEAILKRWSLNGTHVYAYRILVPDARVPEWQSIGIRSLACKRDLYTVFSGDREVDDFERWLNVEFEHRGLEAIDRLVRGLRPNPEDWHNMILFVAAQDLRTPLIYIEWMKRWRKTLPDLLKRVMEQSTKELDAAREQGIVLEVPPIDNEFSGLLRVTIEPSDDPDSGKSVLRSEIPVGRRLWIAGMRHLLTGIAKRLLDYRWSVVEPFGDAEWPMTDHPVLRLNYSSPHDYNFEGGWGSPGTEIMMPVSPRHLLLVQVGRKWNNRFQLPRDKTQLIQQFLVERAHCWVFATSRAEWVERVKPRTVDPVEYAEYEKAWKDFHSDQLQSEVPSNID